jgi:S-DNA-T family DNA segregation ATPase FtsK/SpoIIIE
VQVGQGINGTEAVTTWDNLGHVLVAGMTGMGKSYFLRLLVAQAIQEGHALALADPDGRTFPKLAGHPALFTQLGQTLEGSEQVVNLVDQELRRRIALFGEAENAPDNLEDYNKEAKVKLPRLLVIVDEFNGLVMATGGPKAALAQAVTQIAWRGRKFGVNLILAGQDFTKDIVGPSREMLTTRICFRVASDDTSRIVLNRSGAENLKNPGRALTNAWGLIQTYRAEITALPQGDGLSKEERALAEVLIRDFQGRMSYGALMGMGFSRSRADRIRQDWLTRGLAEVHPDEDNALCVRMSRFSLQTGLPPQAPQTPQTEKGAEQDAE